MKEKEGKTRLHRAVRKIIFQVRRTTIQPISQSDVWVARVSERNMLLRQGQIIYFNAKNHNWPHSMRLQGRLKMRQLNASSSSANTATFSVFSVFYN